MKNRLTATTMPPKSIFGLMALALYLCSVFVGDFSIDGIQASSLLLALTIILLGVLSRPRIDQTGSIMWIVFTFLVLVIMFKVNFNEYYFVGTPVILFPLVYFLVKPLVKPNVAIVVGSVVILVLSTVALIAAGGNLGARTSIIFGPNILYRVIGCFIALALFVPCNRNRLVKASVIVGVPFGIFGMLLTGSRGAVLLLSVIFAIWVVQTRRRLLFTVSVTVTALVLLVLGSSVELPFLDYRIFRFTGNIESIAVRIDAFGSIHEFLQLPIENIMFGYTNFKSLTFIMPHNLFLEAMLGFGSIFMMFLAVGIVSYSLHFVANVRRPHLWWFEIPLIVSFIGSQVSGTFSHNYSVIALGLVGNLLIIRKIKAQSQSTRYALVTNVRVKDPRTQ